MYMCEHICTQKRHVCVCICVHAHVDVCMYVNKQLHVHTYLMSICGSTRAEDCVVLSHSDSACVLAAHSCSQ